MSTPSRGLDLLERVARLAGWVKGDINWNYTGQHAKDARKRAADVGRAAQAVDVAMLAFRDWAIACALEPHRSNSERGAFVECLRHLDALLEQGLEFEPFTSMPSNMSPAPTIVRGED